MLPDQHRNIVLSCCCHDDHTKYDLHVAVVMPDHVHLILTLLTDELLREVNSLFGIMKAIKGASAHAMNRLMAVTGTVWQEESFDHVLRSSESLDDKIQYVLQNPLRRGLVCDWKQYKWTCYRPFSNPYQPPQTT